MDGRTAEQWLKEWVEQEFAPEESPHQAINYVLERIAELEGADALAYRIVNKLRSDNGGLTPDWLVDMGGQDHGSEVGKLHEAACTALERVREIIGREWDFRDARLLADKIADALKEGE